VARGAAGARATGWGRPTPKMIDMFLDNTVTVLDAETFTSMPASLRRKGEPSAWADEHMGGQPMDSFIEGPSFDAEGRLYLVDIPFGRVFRVDQAGEWTLVTEYEGQPNGLKIHPDGRILIADQRRGLLRLDPAGGGVETVLGAGDLPGFKGFNDLTIAANGDVYVTDQGTTGLHDPTGRVLRLTTDGRVDVLLDNVPSPNGVVLDGDERVLFVAATRDNAVWRAPLTPGGGVVKVGRFVSLFGVSGPDGLALDEAGRLVVGHASLGNVFVFAPNGELAVRVRCPTGSACTNVAYGGPERRDLYITDSTSGTVLTARLDVPGVPVPRPAPR
jgi:gluconolactonase